MIPENGTKTHSFKRKRRKRKFNKAFILLIVLVYIVSRTTPILTENPNRFHTLTHGTLEDRLSFEGLILRNEEVVRNASRGLVVEPGERVGKGQLITEGLSSPASGVIVETRDGFEEKLAFNRVLEAPEAHLDTAQEVMDLEAVDSKEGIRIIKGYHWGILGEVSLEEGKELQPGQRIWIESRGKRVRGTVAWSGEKETGEGAWLMVKSTEHLDGIYDNRRQDITLIKREVEGLSVPLDTIYYQEDQAYVTQRKSGNNEKVPVNILLADEEGAILSADEFTDAEGEVHRTVSLYDEVLLNQGNSRGEEGPDE
ncbi:HlyD family efflux transporter periplasmic adaptor subunit [Isachenkonia alkalipeptolytica]|uniref:Uncharacterized protein n=1 Tax=Isachenkonia alkalipeptolytica TaxID=2565777 RepID=A0AA43XMM1_9CLOT|nr:HlyD family efflux transporter periplasmic adaptor subunit [Isachenkonia alkalipeptolytica]NBG89151.1 hypothetical protein [Isachenkonia alkalipeptolytica]